MPTYEYECTKCGHRFELFQRMSDPPRKRCPKCRGRVRRLLGTGAGMIFKGSGFYTTDYRSESYKQQHKKESGGSTKKSDESKATPAPKPGSKPPKKSGS